MMPIKIKKRPNQNNVILNNTLVFDDVTLQSSQTYYVMNPPVWLIEKSIVSVQRWMNTDDRETMRNDTYWITNK